jgi:autotransporter-associated beta strand protein/T5SS/PEP-CTERM-associated repeat protein
MRTKLPAAWSCCKLSLPGIAIITVLVSVLFCKSAAAIDNVYLFSYFQETNGQNGLHIAYSLDGLDYHAVNGDLGLVLDTQSSPFMRDPSVNLGPDGVFRLTYTTGWNGTSFGYMQSTDLINWTNKKTINIMGSVPTTQEVWAPETFYDAANSRYMVYWSSEVTSAASGKRIYYSTTTDFNTFSTPAVLYNPGFTTIDATMVKDGSNYVLFCKDERDGYKYVYKTPVAAGAAGPYPTTPLQRVTPTNYAAEGPTVIQIGGTWYVYDDHYGNGVMGAMASTDDMSTWTEYTDNVSFPSGTRHGTVFTVPLSVAQTLAANAANKPAEDEFIGTAGTSNFQTALNWFAGSVPGAGQTPVIQGGFTVNLTSSPSGTLSGLKVGVTSAGILNISGSSAVSISGSLFAGDRIGGTGTVVQSGTSSVTVSNYSSIGKDGVGTYRLQGGSLTENSDFNVADVRGSHGDLYVEGGSLTANAFYVGSGYNDGIATGNAVGAVHQSGGSVSVTGSGDYLVIGGRDNNLYGVGSYDLSGGTLNSGANSNMFVGKYGQGVFTQSSGTVTAQHYLYIGRYAGSTGSYSISGGTLSQNNTGYRITVGYAGLGTLTVSGTGLVDAVTGLRVSGSSTGSGEIHIDGGTIYTPFVEDGGGTATLHFNGGTLKARNASATFMQGLNTVDVQSGGAVIDSNGFNITIAQPLLAGSPSGGLTKNGSGILTLTGNLTYTGDTLINTGALQLNTGTTTLAAISGQGQLIVGVSGSITQLTASSISGGTLTIAANSTVTISPIAGGPLGDFASTRAVPEPGVWLLLLIAAAAVWLFKMR